MEKNYEIIRRHLAINIRQRRKELLLTQEELAFRAAVDRTYVSQLEREVCNPSLMILCRLADVLAVEVEQLIGAADPSAS